MRNFAEIDLNAIRHNFQLLVADNKGIAVLKADAYGHGAARVASALDSKALAYAVSNIDEAEEIARVTKKTPALILGDGYPPEFARAIDCGAVVSLGSIKNAMIFDELARKKGKRARAVICVDTGMHRDGFDYKDIPGIAAVLEMKNIAVTAIYSHPTRGGDDEFTSVQRKRFFDVKSVFSGRDDIFFSFPNSATIGRDGFVPRIGLSLYGLSPDGKSNSNLLPALSFRAAILSARRVKKGEYVGYGDAFRAVRDMTVATVAAGYGDGVPRALSNKRNVILHAKRAKIVGNVCMDAFMIDVTDRRFDIGDYVTIIGHDGTENITADEAALLCGTISYEILCGISKRVPRIYKEQVENEAEIQMSDT